MSARPNQSDSHYETAVRLQNRVLELVRDNDSLRLERDGSEYIRRRDNEYLIGQRNKWRGLCEMVDAHYSGSLDHQPAYVTAIRSALDEERAA